METRKRFDTTFRITRPNAAGWSWIRKNILPVYDLGFCREIAVGPVPKGKLEDKTDTEYLWGAISGNASDGYAISCLYPRKYPVKDRFEIDRVVLQVRIDQNASPYTVPPPLPDDVELGSRDWVNSSNGDVYRLAYRKFELHSRDEAVVFLFGQLLGGYLDKTGQNPGKNGTPKLRHAEFGFSLLNRFRLEK